MNSVFSDDEISETFWSSSAAMNRSTSEWALERFLEEFSPATPTSRPPPFSADDLRPISDPSASSIDPNHYRHLLKTKLDLACAAVALSRDSPNLVQPQLPSQLGSESLGGVSKPKGQTESDDGAFGAAAVPQKKTVTVSRQTTSGSSKEDSDDDDLDGDMDNSDKSDVKRARRMLSNRESARRSRRRKQAQMSDLETQVGQLRVEHSTLLNRLSDMNHKYDNAAVDNRILKADIETLRAKVKMAEQTVKRVTGINPLLLAASNLSGNESANAVPMQRNSSQLFQQAVPGITPDITHHQRLNGNFGGNSSIPLASNLKNNVLPQRDIGGSKLADQLGPSEGVPSSWGPEAAQQGVAKNIKPNRI